MQEETRSTAAYNKYKDPVQKMDGVLTTYLTRNNNPRELVVVVRDEKTGDAVYDAYSRAIKQEGLRMQIKVVDREGAGDGNPIEAVPTETTPDTWWGRVLMFFQGLRAPWTPAK